MSVSVITACGNRGRALSVSISSWIQFDEIDEIIVTDWSSREPISHLTELDKRIKVVTVPNEQYFNQPQPLNLAASLTKNEYILKLDSDTIMNPYHNFFDHHKIDETTFLTGTDESWSFDDPLRPRSKMQNFQKYLYYKALWGTVYITRENYFKVGGYNENMCYFAAWEDTEIYERLLRLGLKHIEIKFEEKTLFSLPHEAKKRVEEFQAYSEKNDVDIVRNHIKEYNNVEDDNIVHKLVLERHNRANHKKYKLKENSSYYIEPVVKWDIQQVSDQHYVAHKITQ